MLLSRTAENLYWIGRNVERAECTSRLIGEHTNLLVDLPVDVETDWTSLLSVTGSEKGFADRYSGSGEVDVVSFLMADVGNPASVLRSVNSARENLRVTRQLVPGAAWECINRLHLTATESIADCALRVRRIAVADEIVATSQQFGGIMSNGMMRDNAYRFWELGRMVERVDMTVRILNGRAAGLMGSNAPSEYPPADRSPYEDVRWLGVLRSLGAENMYHRHTADSVRGELVVEFLLGNPGFPRSARHCIDRITSLLADLPERDMITRSSAALAEVAGHSGEPIDSAAALAARSAEIDNALAGLHSSLFEVYFAPSSHGGDAHPPTPRAATMAVR